MSISRKVDDALELERLQKRLKKIREDLGLSQLLMATQCNLTTSHYSLIESGKRVPQYGTLLKIAQGLQIPLWKLLREDEEPECAKYDRYIQSIIAMCIALPEEARKNAMEIMKAFCKSQK